MKLANMDRKSNWLAFTYIVKCLQQPVEQLQGDRRTETRWIEARGTEARGTEAKGDWTHLFEATVDWGQGKLRP